MKQVWGSTLGKILQSTGAFYWTARQFAREWVTTGRSCNWRKRAVASRRNMKGNLFKGYMVSLRIRLQSCLFPVAAVIFGSGLWEREPCGPPRGMWLSEQHVQRPWGASSSGIIIIIINYYCLDVRTIVSDKAVLFFQRYMLKYLWMKWCEAWGLLQLNTGGDSD